MITRRPGFYKKFQCIGSACSDNCCIGWEIDIDERTNEVYQSLEGAFGERLRASITTEEDIHFVLEQERCPFLNKKNLCDIITTLGENKLCDICREHPRFYEWFGELTEAGLGLCCEEAARLLLENDQPMLFETANDEAPGNNYSEEQQEWLMEIEEEHLKVLLSAREHLFSLLQNRTYSIWERLSAVLNISVQMQECLDFDDWSGISELIAQSDMSGNAMSKVQIENKTNRYRDILMFYRTLEPMDEKWPLNLACISKEINELLELETSFLNMFSERAYEYEHLAVYLVYRYFLKALFDGELLSRVKAVVLNLLIIKLLDIECWRRTGTFLKEDRIQAVKAYSKEIEYCVENLEALISASWESDIFSVEGLSELLRDH